MASLVEMSKQKAQKPGSARCLASRLMGAMQPSMRAFPSLLVLLFSLWLMGATCVIAQSEPIIWYPTSNLSDTAENSENPAIVADSLGYVHVLWSEDLAGEPFEQTDNPETGNSIFYRRWDGISWTSPVDILAVPDEGVAAFVAVDVDRDHQLHVIWTGQDNFYYSSAPAWEAESAHAWSQPVVVASNSARSRWESDIVADTAGNLHILYATGGVEAGIYHIQSDNSGLSWGSPIKLSGPFDPLETSFSNVQVITDGADRLHAVWETNQNEGYGQAIYYAQSPDGGQSWSVPVQLGYRDPGDYETSYPYLTAISESEIHLIYCDGSDRGRSHRTSQDGGATWSEPLRILTEMEGVNGYVFPLVDGLGQMHLIINMRTRQQVGGIYYARWLGESWTPVEPLVVGDPNLGGAHFAAGTVRLGNELHIAWTQLGNGEIGHVYGVAPWVPRSTPVAVPSPQMPGPLPTSEGQPSSGTSSEPVVPTAPPAAQVPGDSVPLSTQVPSSPGISPIVISTLACLVLLAGVGLWAHLSAQRGRNR